MGINQEKAKEMLAEAICEELKPKITLGLGAGSTVLKVVESLKLKDHSSMQIVVASTETQKRCLELGIDAELMNTVSHIDTYIDGADEVDEYFCLIKGRGGKMTGEKLCAQMADEFVVLVDETKCVKALGDKWPVVAVEVVPWARSSVARQIVKLGGRPKWREVKSDLENDIIDCFGLNLAKPYDISCQINEMTGVVAHGLFVKECPKVVKVSNGLSVWNMEKRLD